MSLHTDRPGKFLFGCLIVLLCWIIGAGQLFVSRSSPSSDPTLNSSTIRQTAGDATSTVRTSPFGWAFEQGPVALFCFLSSVVIWVVSVVSRQLVTFAGDPEDGSGDSVSRSHSPPLWSVFDFFVSLAILGSASVILARGLGWHFSVLIGVTTIVCYYLAYGPHQLAEYCREFVQWLDQHHTTTMVNGDLPLGPIDSEYTGRLVLPPSWWQFVGRRDRAMRLAPAAMIFTGFGLLIAFGLVALWEEPNDSSALGAKASRPPTLLSIPTPRKTPAPRETENGTLLAPILDRFVEVGERLVITPKLANPSAIDGNTSFELRPAVPSTARFYPDSGVLVWTPTEPGTFQFNLSVRSDGRAGPVDSQDFTVVVPESRRSLELAELQDREVMEGELLVVPVRLKSRGPDSHPVHYRLAAGAPEGATIDPDSGLVTWTPTQPGTHRVTVQATADAPGSRRVEKSFSVVVRPAARKPELLEISDRTVKVGELLHVIAQVKDASHLSGNLRYGLGDDSPLGAEIDPDSGLFTWRPTSAGTFNVTIAATTDSATTAPAQQSFRVVVTDQARPPVIGRVDDRTVNEGEPLVIPIRLKSAANPRSAVRFELADDAPAGASVDPDSGVFSWTPTRPGSYPITVRCESLAAGGLSDHTTFTVVVNETNEPPELAEVGNKIVKAGDSLIVPVRIKSAGRPAGSLVFSLGSDAPQGADIDPRSGVIRWAVAANADGGDYSFTVNVSNSARPTLSDRMAFHVTVLEGERAATAEQPAEGLEFEAIADKAVEPGELIRFAIRPKNAGIHPGELEYTLAAGAPEGAAINSRSGLFTWRTNDEHAAHQYWVTVEVCEVDNPARRGKCRFCVRVNQVDSPKHGWSEPKTPAATPPKVLDENEVDTKLPLQPVPEDAPAENRESSDASDGSFTNSIGMKFMPVLDGAFLMGSRDWLDDSTPLDETEAARFKDEQPQHPVRITKSFWMGQCEVTLGQFQRFVEATNYKTEAERGGAGAFAFDAGSHEFKWGKQFQWRNTGWSQTGDHPVVNVSWNDAVAFCRWLSQVENRIYRLPTEAEWEYACRGGTQTRYFTGDSIEDLAAAANLGDESFRQVVRREYSDVVLVAGQEGPSFTTPVGKFQPNNFGLCDMHGNVFEWCADWYGSNYYQESPLVDPAGPTSGTKHVIRGGSFFNSPFYSRSSFRNGFPSDARVPYLGFRCVMESEAPAPESPASESTKQSTFRSVIEYNR
jgi:sulfatase modifying factor 1